MYKYEFVMRFVMFGAFSIIALLIDVYVVRAVRAAVQSWQPINRQRAIRGFWLLTLGYLVFSFVGHVVASQAAGPNSPVLRMVFGAFVLFYAPKLCVVVVLLAEDVVRLVRWFGRLVRPRPVVPASADELPNGATEKIGRSEFLSRSALGLSLVPFGSIAHGMASGVYNYQVHEVEIPLSRLPQAFDGFTITHISDLHLGSLAQIPAALRGFELIRNLNSDMVLFTGDLVNNLASEALPWIDELKSITAPNGVVAALGNHDYGWHYPYFSGRHESDANFRLLDEVYKRAGWYLLKNFGFKLERDGECLGVAVTENWGRAARFPKRADLNKSLEGIEPEVCTIVLTHDPTFWDEHMLKHPRFFDLTLSGHTHGMQFGLETGGIKVSPVSFIYPRWAGLYQEQGQYLYVNRGFGFIGFPGRVGIYPEITRITLRCAPGRHAL